MSSRFLFLKSYTQHTGKLNYANLGEKRGGNEAFVFSCQFTFGISCRTQGKERDCSQSSTVLRLEGKVKSVYEPSGPSGRNLSRFP